MKKALSIVLSIFLLVCNVVFSFWEGTKNNTNYDESLQTDLLVTNIPDPQADAAAAAAMAQAGGGMY